MKCSKSFQKVDADVITSCKQKFITLSDDVKFNQNVGICGTLVVCCGLKTPSITPSGNSLVIEGNVDIEKNLFVQLNETIGGNLQVNGNTILKGPLISGTGGIEVCEGPLRVNEILPCNDSDTVTIGGNVIVDGTITVGPTGTIDLCSAPVLISEIQSCAGPAGTVTVTSDLDVTGNLTVCTNTIRTNNISSCNSLVDTLSIDGNVLINDNLTVVGTLSTCVNDFRVTSMTSCVPGDAINVNTPLVVNDNSTVTGNFRVFGDTIIDGTLSVCNQPISTQQISPCAVGVPITVTGRTIINNGLPDNQLTVSTASALTFTEAAIYAENRDTLQLVSEEAVLALDVPNSLTFVSADPFEANLSKMIYCKNAASNEPNLDVFHVTVGGVVFAYLPVSTGVNVEFVPTTAPIGAGNKTGGYLVQQVSTKDKKKDIEPIKVTYDIFQNVPVCQYRYKSEPDSEPLKYGIIAEDLLENETTAKAVVKNKQTDAVEGYSNQTLMALLIGSHQDLVQRIELLPKELVPVINNQGSVIKELVEKFNLLVSRVDQLEELVTRVEQVEVKLNK